jgi:hypothetical protein
VIDCSMFGALAAAERHQLPAVVLVHSAPGVLVPPGGPFERLVLLEAVNALRSAAGLPPVASIWESWARFPTLCASLPALDPLAASVPRAFTFVGPIQEQLPATDWNRHHRPRAWGAISLPAEHHLRSASACCPGSLSGSGHRT